MGDAENVLFKSLVAVQDATGASNEEVFDFANLTLGELAKLSRENAGEKPNGSKIARDAEALLLVGQAVGFGEPYATAVKKQFSALAKGYESAMRSCEQETRDFQEEQRRLIRDARESVNEAAGEIRKTLAKAHSMESETTRALNAVEKAMNAFSDPLAANIAALQRVMMDEYRRANVSADEAARAVSYTLWAYAGASNAAACTEHAPRMLQMNGVEVPIGEE